MQAAERGCIDGAIMPHATQPVGSVERSETHQTHRSAARRVSLCSTHPTIQILGTLIFALRAASIMAASAVTSGAFSRRCIALQCARFETLCSLRCGHEPAIGRVVAAGGTSPLDIRPPFRYIPAIESRSVKDAFGRG